MSHRTLECLDEVSVALQHGYLAAPASGLKQVLWFRLESIAEMASRRPSLTHFWIEWSSGPMQAIRVIDLGITPKAFIAYLAGLAALSDDSTDPVDRSLTGETIAQDFYVTQIESVSVIPQPEFISTSIQVLLGILCSSPHLDPDRRVTIEDVLNETHSTIEEKFGFGGETWHFTRHACTSNPSSPRPTGLDVLHPDVRAFRAALSPDILAVLEHYARWLPGIDSLRNYNTIAAWHGMVRRNRLQAIQAFPWLIHEFALTADESDVTDPPSGRFTLLTPEILAAIDNGCPLLPLIAKRYQVAPHTIRHASKLLREDYFLKPGLVPAFLWLLDAMKPDKRQFGLQDTVNLMTPVIWLHAWRLDEDRSFVGMLAETLYKDGLEGAANLFKRWCPTHNPDTPYSDLEDFLADHALRLEPGTALSSKGLGRLFKQWVDKAGLRAVFEESERWHLAWLTRERIAIDMAWGPLLSSPVSAGTLVAHELCDTEMFVEEGVAMRHCIASYVGICADGNAYVYSLRTHEGMRRSTVLITRGGPPRFTIQEHRGFANRDPDSECLAAADALVAHLREHELAECL